MEKTNEQIVAEVSEKIQLFLQQYISNLNSCVSSVEKTEQGNYIIPALRAEKVELNIINNNNDVQKVRTSEVTMSKRHVASIKPLVRILIPIEEIFQFNQSNSYLRLSISGIVSDVQKVWEKNLGSYQVERFGETFLNIKPLQFTDGDKVILDFYGDWATNKEAE